MLRKYNFINNVLFYFITFKINLCYRWGIDEGKGDINFQQYIYK